MQCFGGKLKDGSLPGTGFDSSDYYTLSFNDFASSMVTLFVLMVVSNWSIIMAGYETISGTAWSRLVRKYLFGDLNFLFFLF